MMGQLIDREIKNVAVAPNGVVQWKKSLDRGHKSMNTMKKICFLTVHQEN